MILITITEDNLRPLVTVIDVDNNHECITSKTFDTDYDAGLAISMLRDVFQYCCGRSVRIENKMAPRVYVG